MKKVKFSLFLFFSSGNSSPSRTRTPLARSALLSNLQSKQVTFRKVNPLNSRRFALATRNLANAGSSHREERVDRRKSVDFEKLDRTKGIVFRHSRSNPAVRLVSS